MAVVPISLSTDQSNGNVFVKRPGAWIAECYMMLNKPSVMAPTGIAIPFPNKSIQSHSYIIPFPEAQNYPTGRASVKQASLLC